MNLTGKDLSDILVHLEEVKNYRYYASILEEQRENVKILQQKIENILDQFKIDIVEK